MEIKTITWLYKQAKSVYKGLLFLSIASVLLSISRVAFIASSKIVIDGALLGDITLLYQPIMFLSFLTLGQLALRLLVPAMEDALQTQLEMHFRKRLLSQMFDKPYAALKETAIGEWMTRFFSDTEITASGLATLVPTYLRICVNIMLSVVLLYQLVPQVTIALALLGIGLFLMNLLFRRRLKSVHKAVQQSKGRLQVYLQELMTNLIITKVFQAEEQSLEKLHSLHTNYAFVRKRRRFLSVWTSLGMQGSVQIAYLFVICLGSLSIIKGEMTYGTLIALMQLVNNLMTPISNLSSATSRFYGMLASGERLMALESIQPETIGLETYSDVGDFQSLSFKNVDFSYDDKAETMLSQVNFSFSKGEKIALTGTSGNGKSTLFYLMLGLYPVDSGQLKLQTDKGLFDYTQLSLVAIRSLFTYVPQDHALFSGSVRDNLLLGQPNRTDSEIWQALKMASAKEFVEKLPGQLDHPLGEYGKTLSHGQQQRLALARAFLSDAPILLFDEATSALDSVTEKQVLESVANLLDKTCVIVTHRSASLEVCDRQLILEQGKIKERKL